LSLVLLIRQPITPPLHHWNQAPMSLDLGAEPGWLHPATNHAHSVSGEKRKARDKLQIKQQLHSTERLTNQLSL
jgi:hypothetical protein